MGIDSPSDQPPDRVEAERLSPTRGAAATERAFGLRIARDGSWWHEGRPIGRPALVKLFASVLRREADGSYWLVTPVERGRIPVEDVPFVAVELAVEGVGAAQTLRLRTNLDEWITVGPAHPLRLQRPVAPAGNAAAVSPDADADAALASPDADTLIPYVLVRPGLEARLVRAVYYHLVELGLERCLDGRMRFGVWSAGVFFALDAAG
jgi:hypothetical protein